MWWSCRQFRTFLARCTTRQFTQCLHLRMQQSLRVDYCKEEGIWIDYFSQCSTIRQVQIHINLYFAHFSSFLDRLNKDLNSMKKNSLKGFYCKAIKLQSQNFLPWGWSYKLLTRLSINGFAFQGCLIAAISFANFLAAVFHYNFNCGVWELQFYSDQMSIKCWSS